MRQEEKAWEEEIDHHDGERIRIVRHRRRPSAVWLSLLFGVITLFASFSFLLWGQTHAHQQVDPVKESLTEVAYVVLALIPAALSVLFGVVGFRRINSHPRRYKGKRLALLGIVMSASYLIGVILYLWTNQ